MFDREPMLVDENASLVEEPHVVTGSFDPAFLSLAQRRSFVRSHADTKSTSASRRQTMTFLPSYLAVVNTANRPDLIVRGTNRVMRARLSDARFFWDEDRKSQLEGRFEKLGGIVFHHRLGTVREKVERIERLATRIADLLSLSKESRSTVARAARLSKCDLVSLMVGEFPELQGHMGRAYALAQGEVREVADALRDHYKPLGAQDDVAQDDVSAVIGLADRVDTLAGCFAVGLVPTGAADPFALRRACIGVLRILLDRGYGSLAFSDLASLAYDAFEGKKLDLQKTETVAKLEEFATERLRGLLAAASSNQVADAVIAASGPAALRNVVASLARALALQTVVDAKEPWLDKAKTVAKRLAGISREAQSQSSTRRRSLRAAPRRTTRFCNGSPTTSTAPPPIWPASRPYERRFCVWDLSLRNLTASSSKPSSTTRATPLPRYASKPWHTARSRCCASPIFRSSDDVGVRWHVDLRPNWPHLPSSAGTAPSAPTGGSVLRHFLLGKNPSGDRHQGKPRLHRIDHDRRSPHGGGRLSREREDRHLRRHERRAARDIRDSWRPQFGRNRHQWRGGSSRHDRRPRHPRELRVDGGGRGQDASTSNRPRGRKQPIGYRCPARATQPAHALGGRPVDETTFHEDSDHGAKRLLLRRRTCRRRSQKARPIGRQGRGPRGDDAARPSGTARLYDCHTLLQHVLRHGPFVGRLAQRSERSALAPRGRDLLRVWRQGNTAARERALGGASRCRE